MEIEDLSLFRAFLGVAREGNFSKAAKSLKVPLPQLSKRVAKLEQELGIRLFHRSTRVVSLTDEGLALMPKIATILSDVAEIGSIFEERGELSGKVKVTCVSYVAHTLLLPALKDFMALHPKIKIDLQLTKNRVNLIEENVDMAIRIETPSDSEMIYKKLASNNLIFCASPEYLKNNPAPLKKPEDLIQHDLLFLGIHHKVKFVEGGLSLKKFESRKRIECENGTFLTDMALKGYGVLVRAHASVKEDLKAGRLVQVLGKHPLETFGHVYAVIPSKRFLAPRVRAFFDFVVEQSKLAGKN